MGGVIEDIEKTAESIKNTLIASQKEGKSISVDWEMPTREIPQSRAKSKRWKETEPTGETIITIIIK